MIGDEVSSMIVDSRRSPNGSRPTRYLVLAEVKSSNKELAKEKI